MNKNLKSELDSWNIKEESERRIKLEREWIRYPYLVDKIGINNLLYLEEKIVLDIGSGPMGGILNFINSKKKISLDPLNKEYVENFKDFYKTDFEYIVGSGEKIPLPDNSVDLVTCTNALDHAENPELIIKEIKRVLSKSGYVAMVFCISLASIHPHPAHVHNITPYQFHKWVDKDFETIFSKEDRYGWVKYLDKVGQPCYIWFGRLTTKG